MKGVQGTEKLWHMSFYKRFRKIVFFLKLLFLTMKTVPKAVLNLKRPLQRFVSKIGIFTKLLKEFKVKFLKIVKR